MPNIDFLSNDPATSQIYTLSLHDALPIYAAKRLLDAAVVDSRVVKRKRTRQFPAQPVSAHPGEVLEEQRRSEEHTSELQSQSNLVCRLLVEKKKIELLVISGNAETIYLVI